MFKYTQYLISQHMHRSVRQIQLIKGRNSTFRNMCDTGVNDCDTNTYEAVERIAQYLQGKVSIQPQIGIICGTGLGAITDTLSNQKTFEYKDIPNFPVSTVQGHNGRLIFGCIGSVPVVCMQGRFHFFEGYPLWKIVLPVRVMKLLGVSSLILSNAAGSINPSYNIGDIMIIKDHINFLSLAGHNPLRGPNDERWGPRFVAINDAYNKQFIKTAKGVAEDMKLKRIQEGVYFCLGGPCFETVAELKALKTLGADAVGMSTAHEVITARHCGIKCFAFSLITNKCPLDYECLETPDHEEILTVGKDREEDVKEFVESLVQRLHCSEKMSK